MHNILHCCSVGGFKPTPHVDKQRDKSTTGQKTKHGSTKLRSPMRLCTSAELDRRKLNVRDATEAIHPIRCNWKRVIEDPAGVTCTSAKSTGECPPYVFRFEDTGPPRQQCLAPCLNRRAPSNIRLEMHERIPRNQTYVPSRV